MMRECDWSKFLKSTQNLDLIETRMPRILLNDTEETLLKAIQNDEVFGFAVCSVWTDPEDIAEMEKVN